MNISYQLTALILMACVSYQSHTMECEPFTKKKPSSKCISLQKLATEGLDRKVSTAGYLNLKHLKLTSPEGLSEIPAIKDCCFVDLSYNELTKFHADTLNELPQLLWLDLSHNKLKKLHRHVFSKLTALLWLNLAHNQFTDFHTDSITHLTKLYRVSFHDNQISEEKQKTIRQALPKIEFLF